MIDPETTERLRQLYQNLGDKPLWPDDPRYVDLFTEPSLQALDPVERLAIRIRFSSIESSQLFSGHRGTGKSTQLRRLVRELERDPRYKVVLCDMEDFLPMTDAVDEVDFLLGAAGALAESLAAPELLGKDPSTDYWSRFVGWLKGQRIEVKELGLDAKVPVGPGVSFNVKANLKSDAEFRKRVRERMKLHQGAFRAEVH
ncbi:MAG: ATP-binding protein, partial [Myxococcales bacterium]|nr:ATP-binding protein [Myxococcales bacterium]